MMTRMARRIWSPLVLLSVLAAGPVWAQEEEESEVSLKAGDKAPPLKIEKWIKGDAVNAFEKGKVYVVEFWATWCGPCVASMPHLSALQKTYKDKGVTFIGVNVWEDKDYTEDTLKKVQDFVKDQGDRMAYTVAFDGKTKATDKAYMTAAGQNGIPTAFLIDKTGTIAWIGHPMWLDVPLEKVVKDTWDLKTGPKEIAKGQERLSDVFEKMRDEPKEAVGAWESFERDYPTVAENLKDAKFTLFLRAGQYEKAYKLGNQLVDQAIADKDSGLLNSLAWSIVDPEGEVKTKDLDLAMKAATKANELTKHENAAIIDTLARVHFLKGDVDKAIDLENKAIEKAEGPLKDELKKALDEYKDARRKTT